MGIQDSVNQVIGSVGKAIALPKIIEGVNKDDQFSIDTQKYKEDKLKFQQKQLQQKKRELKAHTKQWKTQQIIRAEAQADMQSRLEEKRQIKKERIYIGGQELNPSSDLYKKLTEEGDING